MHSPSDRALRHLDRYCIIQVRTLKHVSPAKCVTTITYGMGTITNIKKVFTKRYSTAYACRYHNALLVMQWVCM